jgi:hypothetical protein
LVQGRVVTVGDLEIAGEGFAHRRAGAGPGDERLEALQRAEGYRRGSIGCARGRGGGDSRALGADVERRPRSAVRIG